MFLVSRLACKAYKQAGKYLSTQIRQDVGNVCVCVHLHITRGRDGRDGRDDVV